MAATKKQTVAGVFATLAFLFTPDCTALLTLAVGLMSASLFDLADGADGVSFPSEVELEAAMYYGPSLARSEAAPATNASSGQAAALTPTPLAVVNK
jgi:hypothetical protein